MGENAPLDLGLKVLPTGLGFKVGKNTPFYTTDDTSLFSVVRDINTSAARLNNDLRKISNRAFQWKMSFNHDPSKQDPEVIFSQTPKNKSLLLLLLLLLLFIYLFKVDKLEKILQNYYIKIAIPTCGMLIKVNYLSQ